MVIPSVCLSNTDRDSDRAIRRCLVPVTCMPPEAQGSPPWVALLYGVATASLLLYSPLYCGRRQFFEVEFPEGVTRRRFYARVVSCEPVSLLGGWVLACALVRYGLTEQQLSALGDTARPALVPLVSQPCYSDRSGRGATIGQSPPFAPGTPVGTRG